MSYIRECVNGISQVLLIGAISLYVLNYALDTPIGREVCSSIDNFISHVGGLDKAQDSLEYRLK